MRQRVFNAFGRKRNLDAFSERLIILRHANIVQREISSAPSKTVKLREDKCTRKLPRTIRAEVKEDHAVVFPNRSNRRTVFHNDHRDYEFIRYTCIIGCLHRRLRIFCLHALPINECRIGFLHAFKAVIPSIA